MVLCPWLLFSDYGSASEYGWNHPQLCDLSLARFKLSIFWRDGSISRRFVWALLRAHLRRITMVPLLGFTKNVFSLSHWYVLFFLHFLLTFKAPPSFLQFVVFLLFQLIPWSMVECWCNKDQDPNLDQMQFVLFCWLNWY